MPNYGNAADWAKRQRQTKPKTRPTTGTAPWEIDRQRGGSNSGGTADADARDQQRLDIADRLGWGLDAQGNFSSAAGANARPPAAPPGPTGGQPRGGGGYGGGSAAPQFNPYFDAVMGILQKQQGKPAWADKIGGYVDADVAAARDAFAGIPAADSNPYANLEFQQAQPLDPQMAALLEAQGIDPAVYGAQVGAANQGLDSMAALWDNYATSRAADVDASNAAYSRDVGAMEAQTVANLEAQRAALEMAALQQEQARKDKTIEAVLALLGQGYAAGQDVSKLDLGGMF